MRRFQLEQGEVSSQAAQHSTFTTFYDVIVVGLGTAGAIAAITAASKGLRVLGLERLHCMGGTGTVGAVVGYYFGSKGGLFEGIDEETLRLEAEGYTKAGGINAELKKYVLEQRALDAGATIQYESTVIGVYLDDSHVKGVRWLGPGGIEEAGCHIVIDSSGDAEVCAMIGAAARPGRKLDGKMQPFSNPIISVQDNHVRVSYTDSGYVNQADERDLTRSIMQSATVSTHLPERFDESRKFLKLAPQLGIREGRFIEGEEQVTFAGVLDDQLSEQPLFFAYSNMDNHNKDIAFENDLQQDWAVAASLWGLNMSVPIPLGALIPKGIDNLLVAGRSLAVDHDLAACVRMKRDMQKCGEAAALAAMVAIQENLPLRDIPYDLLRPLLMENGCLRESNHVRLRDSAFKEDDKNALVTWLNTEEEIHQGLSGIKPGIAIWSARRIGMPINARLKEWLHSTDHEHLSRHSAFALALQGDRAAIPVLREMMKERDPFVPKTSRKYNQVRGYTAVYLLGKLGDVESVPDLLQIIKSREEFVNCSTDVEFINHNDEYYFQYFSFSLMALFRIANLNPAVRESITNVIEPMIDDPGFSINVTLKPSNYLNFDMADTVRDIVRKQLVDWRTVVHE